MSHANIYDLCCRYHGTTVGICDRDNRIHIDEVTSVDRQYVWLLPVRNCGGIGYGSFGGYGGWGYGYPLALGAIAGITLTSLFYW